MDHPDFRRSGKIFAGLQRGEKMANLRLSPEIQATVLHAGSPFEPCSGAWGRSGWTQVELARVETSVLKELLREAWELIGLNLRAPRKKKAAAPKAKAKAKRASTKQAPAKKKARARR